MSDANILTIKNLNESCDLSKSLGRGYFPTLLHALMTKFELLPIWRQNWKLLPGVAQPLLLVICFQFFVEELQ